MIPTAVAQAARKRRASGAQAARKRRAYTARYTSKREHWTGGLQGIAGRAGPACGSTWNNSETR